MMTSTPFALFVAAHNKLKSLFAMRHGKNVALLLGSILGLPIALFTPSDVLTAHPWLVAFVDFFDQRLAMISEFSLPTRFPEVAKLYYSFQCALLPFWLYCFYLVPVERMVLLDKIKSERFLIPILAMAFLFTIYFVFVLGTGDPHRPLRGVFTLTQSSRLALGVFGGLIVSFLNICIYTITLYIIRFRDIYLK